MEFHIVVGWSSTAGVHSDSKDGAGTTPTVTIITECTQGETVQVKALNYGATRWGNFEGINVSVFSGTILALL